MVSMLGRKVVRTAKDAEIKNAKISGTFLGIEDHGILTFMVHLEFSGSGQSFGLCSLDVYDKKTDGRRGLPICAAVVRALLDALEVDSWEKLKGQHVRARCDTGKVYAIGHIIKDQWVDLEELWKKYAE